MNKVLQYNVPKSERCQPLFPVAGRSDWNIRVWGDKGLPSRTVSCSMVPAPAYRGRDQLPEVARADRSAAVWSQWVLLITTLSFIGHTMILIEKWCRTEQSWKLSMSHLIIIMIIIIPNTPSVGHFPLLFRWATVKRGERLIPSEPTFWSQKQFVF